MKFADLAGQKEIINRILENIKNGRVSHAQMFISSEGSGALPLALAYAQYINCTDKQFFSHDSAKIKTDSCGECPSCNKSRKMIHPDIHFVVPVNESKKVSKGITRDFLPLWRKFIIENSAYINLNQWYNYIEIEKQGIISAEECNEIINTLTYKAYESEYKVMIIWMIEKLYYSAAPKLLKILEEPSDKTLFLLISENPQQVLETIMSRAQLIKIPRLHVSDITDYLSSKHGIEYQKSVRLSDRYNRNLSDILGNLRNELDAEHKFKQFSEWMRICFKQNMQQIISMSKDFKNLGRENQKLFFNYSLSQIRNAWVNKYSEKLKEMHEPTQIEFYNKFGKYLNSENVFLLHNELENGILGVERHANQRILFTDITLKIGNYLKLKIPG